MLTTSQPYDKHWRLARSPSGRKATVNLTICKNCNATAVTVRVAHPIDGAVGAVANTGLHRVRRDRAG